MAIDSATPLDDSGPDGHYMDVADAYGGYGGPVRSYGRMFGSMDFENVSINL